MRSSFQGLPIPQPDPDQVRERADQVMARSEFNQSKSILDRLGRWLNELFAELFTSLAQGGAGSVMAWVILVALVVGAVVMLTRVWPLGGMARRSASASATVEISGPAAADVLTAAQWRFRARALFDEAKFDEALRARYRAVLADLVTEGLIDDIPGRTPGEYRTELAAAAPPVAGAFGELTAQFENVWYGAAVADAADLAQFEQRERAVLAGVGS